MTVRKPARGGWSIFRLALVAGGIGLGLILIGVLIFLSDQASRRAPFNVPTYPSAVEWGMRDVRPTSRTMLYRERDASPEEVAAFYQQQMERHYGDGEESCVRIPASGNNPINPNDPLSIPYQFRCLFDNSGFQTTQLTQVLIYPGTFDPDPDMNSEGMTVIEYQQRWTQ